MPSRPKASGATSHLSRSIAALFPKIWWRASCSAMKKAPSPVLPSVMPASFSEADGGTLFLDEVGELPHDIQVKLLRAVQSGEIETIGARVPKKGGCPPDLGHQQGSDRRGQGRPVSARISTTGSTCSRSMFRRCASARKTFRKLVRHFTQHYSETIGRGRIRGIAPDAMALLTAHDWPGNIRELENSIYRAIVLCDGDTLTSNLFPADRRPDAGIQSRSSGRGRTI